jgi:hypothetical protein
MLHGYIVLGVLARIMFNVKRLVASMTALSAGRMNHESSGLIDMYRLQFAWTVESGRGEARPAMRVAPSPTTPDFHMAPQPRLHCLHMFTSVTSRHILRSTFEASFI